MQELEIEALGDGHGSDEGAPGEALSEFADNSHAGSDQDVMTIDHDARDEDVAQQSARGTRASRISCQARRKRQRRRVAALQRTWHAVSG